MSTDATRPSPDDRTADQTAGPSRQHQAGHDQAGHDQAGHDRAKVDPVRARRRQIAKWTLIANRVGYLFYAFAIAAFVLAFALGFNSTMSALVIGSLVIGSILLAPAIVLGYAVKAAERDDRERGF